MALCNLLLSGGDVGGHDFAATTSRFVNVLAEIGVTSIVCEDLSALEDGTLNGCDMLTLNCVRCTFAAKPELRERGMALSEKARHHLADFFAAGKGMLAIHGAVACFDDWPDFPRILGATWEWGRSGHSPVLEHRIRVTDVRHPITDGLSDFTITDEMHVMHNYAVPIEPLLTGTWENQEHPLLWARTYGAARICYNAFGHSLESFANPTNRLLLQRSALWATKRLGSPS